MSEISLSKGGLSPPPVGERENLYASLGSGLITGAADDDPSGIATYSQVSAQFGFAMLWTMLFSFPLMAAIQEICARLGQITGMGVAANLAKCYPKTVVRGLVFLLCVANIFNLGADVAAMAAAFQLLVGGKLLLYAIFFGGVSLLLQVYVPYRIYVRYLKWLTWALFAYVLTAFVVRVPWTQALRSTLVPSVSLDPAYLMALIAVLGTTISPYLFSTVSAFKQPLTQRRLCILWLDALLPCCSRSESLGPECWLFRFWPDPRRMQFRNYLPGGQAWRASRATRESFTTFFPGPPFLACA